MCVWHFLKSPAFQAFSKIMHKFSVIINNLCKLHSFLKIFISLTLYSFPMFDLRFFWKICTKLCHKIFLKTATS